MKIVPLILTIWDNLWNTCAKIYVKFYCTLIITLILKLIVWSNMIKEIWLLTVYIFLLINKQKKHNYVIKSKCLLLQWIRAPLCCQKQDLPTSFILNKDVIFSMCGDISGEVLTSTTLSFPKTKKWAAENCVKFYC